MELFRLHYFLELCKVKQFTKAAENLAISQAALSKQIKILEATRSDSSHHDRSRMPSSA